MMNLNVTLTDVLALMNVKAANVTKATISNDEDYKAEVKAAKDHNDMWTKIEAAYKQTGIKDADVIKAMTDSAAGGPKIDINEIDKKYIAQYQAAADAQAFADRIKNIEIGIEAFKEMGLITNESQQIVSTPAPAPAPVPAAPAESRMTMAERKAIIRDMVGTGSGTNQFRRHCSTTAQANAARAKIEEWRSKGYITGGQKAELRAEVNAAAWLGHCGVTATR